MMQSTSASRNILAKTLVLTCLIGLTACQTSTPDLSSTPTPSSPTLQTPITPVPDEIPSDSSQSRERTPTAKTQVEVYWLKSQENKLELSPATVTITNAGASEQAQLAAALERLLQGPANADVASSIPDGTQLNSLTLEKDGVHIDLTQTFISGGGSTSMQGRLGQIIYTASSLNPNEPVWISINGEPLKVLGGEGLEVSQPLTRQEFREAFPLM